MAVGHRHHGCVPIAINPIASNLVNLHVDHNATRAHRINKNELDNRSSLDYFAIWCIQMLSRN
ncbi:hypothetical protein ACTXT7_002790 [Hymenolepis weldensis]